MELTGILTQVLPPLEGEGKNGKWIKCEFIIETEEKYPKKICISAWGDLVPALKNYEVGNKIQLQADVASREYNGKWYTDVKAWRFEPKVASPADGSIEHPVGAENMNQRDAPPNETESKEDDLPF